LADFDNKTMAALMKLAHSLYAGCCHFAHTDLKKTRHDLLKDVTTLPNIGLD
jgi:hypothetical protein